MGVIRFEREASFAVAPSRMFKAIVLDSHNLFPNLFPQALKSIEFEQGDGGVGSVKVSYLAEGNKHKYAKQRVDALDKDNFMYRCTFFDEDYMVDVLESSVFEIKFEDSGNGGSICKTCNEYHIKGDDQEIKELEELKGIVDQGMASFKIIEAHLLANPDLYA